MTSLHWFGNILFLLKSEKDEIEIVDWVHLGSSPEECAENIRSMQQGGSFEILDSFVSKNWPASLSSDDCMKLGQYGALFDNTPVSAEMPLEIAIETLLLTNSIFESEAALQSVLRETGLALAKDRLRKRGEDRDRYVVQAIHAIDDMDRILNLVSNRTYEWYGIHFPELFDLSRDNLQFLRFVRLGSRDSFTEKNLSDLSDKRQQRILEAKGDSLGVDLPEEDLQPVQKLASFGVEIARVRDDLERYVDAIMPEIAPNLTALIGGRLGARLIASTGSLENLAKKPSSTMQVLGAEKALFRSLKDGSQPPKHGYLFQSPLVHRAPLHQRGKIARVLAGKLSIAARVDFFSGEFIADELQKEIDARLKEIASVYPKPPKRKQKKKLKRSKTGGRRPKTRRRQKRPKKDERRN
ncbi:MAG: NOP5/NOP56 family protein [Candidatus Hodarchaeales archaeon]